MALQKKHVNVFTKKHVNVLQKKHVNVAENGYKKNMLTWRYKKKQVNVVRPLFGAKSSQFVVFTQWFAGPFYSYGIASLMGYHI